MSFTTTVTQKGQITLPKKFRDKLGIRHLGKVVIHLEPNSLRIEATQDILDLAGSVKPRKGKSVLKARQEFEKKYKRA